MTSSLELPRQQ